MIVPRTSPGSVQLLGRVLAQETLPNALVVLPPEPGLSRIFAEALPGARYLHLDYSVYLNDRALWQADGGDHPPLFVDGFDEVPAASSAIVFLPKEKELAEFLFASVAARLPERARVWVAGENRGGIRSIRPLLESTLGPVRTHHSGRHALVWEATVGPAPPPPRDLRRRFEFQVNDVQMRAVTYPGVFSHGELDPGTRLLLTTLGQAPYLRALDWGCGAGILGTYLRRMISDATVDLVDTHALALRSARETLEANGYPGDRVYASDVFSDVQGSFDLIVTNPPFHAGLKTTLGPTQRMIREAGRFLLPGGRLVMVANHFLRYPAVLRESFTTVRVLAEDGGFRVYEASNDLGDK